MSKKGFTLIELLAVIVILGVLLAIAIPSVAKYINTAKKSTYIENVQSYANAARNELFLTNSDYQLPVSYGEATAITFKELENALENGGKKSPYGAKFVDEYSYVMIVNDGSAEKPHFTYYIAAVDEKGYGIGVKKNNSTGMLMDNYTASITKSFAALLVDTYARMVRYDDLNEDYIIQFNGGLGRHVDAAARYDVLTQDEEHIQAQITNKYGFQ